MKKTLVQSVSCPECDFTFSAEHTNEGTDDYTCLSCGFEFSEFHDGLSETEAELAATLLDKAADEFANHGCNDLDLSDCGMAADEIEKLHERMAQFNNNPDDAGTGPLVSDWYLMSYLAARLRGEV